MKIVDNHAHIFPYLGGNSEYEKKGIQKIYLQKAASQNVQPIHRKDTNEICNDKRVWNPKNPSLDGMYNVDFRVGNFGRLEWTIDNTDYWKQWMPVSLQSMESPPEFLLAQMDYVGIEKAVLQRSHAYGKLENYYYETLKKYPNKFIALTQINEAYAYKDEEITKVHHAIKKLGLKGLYFEPRSLFLDNFRYKFDDQIFEVFWKEIESLAIPVYLQTETADFIDQITRLNNILEKHHSLVCVIAMGLPQSIAIKNDKIHIPEIVNHVISQHNVFLELAYPISVGLSTDYPYPASKELIKSLLGKFGAEKLIWGSDIPNVERFCTYAQSLNYMTRYCTFLSDRERELIFGENVLRIFNEIS